MRKGQKPDGPWIKDTPRSSDEDVLDMIHQKCQGLSWRQISKRFGKSSVQQLCYNVLNDDLAYSKEPEETVRAAYW